MLLFFRTYLTRNFLKHTVLYHITATFFCNNLVQVWNFQRQVRTKSNNLVITIKKSLKLMMKMKILIICILGEFFFSKFLTFNLLLPYYYRYHKKTLESDRCFRFFFCLEFSLCAQIRDDIPDLRSFQIQIVKFKTSSLD
jgi:hypothetical protein